MPNDATIADLRARIEEIVSSGPNPACSKNASLSPDVKPLPRTPDESDLAGECVQVRLPAANEDCQPKSDSQAAFQKVVALVNASDKSEATLRSRLGKAGFTEEAIAEALEKARRFGIVDDARFAEILVRSRISQRRGSVGIERELRSNAIDPQSLPGWPDDYGISFDSELDRALELLRRKPPRSRNIRESAYRKLVQKGYPSSVAASAARMFFEENTPASAI